MGLDEYKAARASGKHGWQKEYEDQLFAGFMERYPNTSTSDKMAVLAGHYSALLNIVLTYQEATNA